MDGDMPTTRRPKKTLIVFGAIALTLAVALLFGSLVIRRHRPTPMPSLPITLALREVTARHSASSNAESRYIIAVEITLTNHVSDTLWVSAGDIVEMIRCSRAQKADDRAILWDRMNRFRSYQPLSMHEDHIAIQGRGKVMYTVSWTISSSLPETGPEVLAIQSLEEDEFVPVVLDWDRYIRFQRPHYDGEPTLLRVSGSSAATLLHSQ